MIPRLCRNFENRAKKHWRSNCDYT